MIFDNDNDIQWNLCNPKPEFSQYPTKIDGPRVSV